MQAVLSLFTPFYNRLFLSIYRKKTLTVHAVKPKPLKVLILGMYMSVSVILNLQVSLTQFQMSGEMHVHTSATPVLKVYFFTEVAVIGI